MYQLCVKKDFIARHFLFGGEWGEENQPHSHHYELEARLGSATLDDHGYVYDICLLKEGIAAIVAQYEERMLNDLEAFAGLNPSLEHFARILGVDLLERLPKSGLRHFTLRLWEDREAWVEWNKDFY